MSIASIGLSGMRAAQSQLDTTAHNVANAQTPNFRRQTVTPTAAPGLGGVTTTVTQQPASAVQSTAEVDHMPDDMVAQKMAVYNFAANLRSVEAEDQMLGSLLDTKA